MIALERSTLPPPLGAAARRASDGVVIGVRPEHIELRALDGATSDTALPGRVFFREPRGDVDVVLVSRDGGAEPRLVTVETPAGEEWKEGDSVLMTLRQDALHVFDAATGRNLA